MTKVIQLAKPYVPSKLGNEVYVSVKLDGVPIRVTIEMKSGEALLRNAATRQDEFPVSCTFILRDLVAHMSKSRWADGLYELVGEVTHEVYTDFKDVSGVVRKQSAQTGLILNLFDLYHHGYDVGFGARAFALELLLRHHLNTVRVVRQSAVYRDQIEQWFEDNLPEGAEGGVIRDAHDKWAPGKRTWGYQKYLKKPTIDLRLHSYEEAVSKDGINTGMVGRINVHYKGGVIGVGPGKLTHADRTELWQNNGGFVFGADIGAMMCIQYKADPSYDALREPTFQHWRYDKDEADA